VENTQRNSLTICEPLSQPSENSQSPQTEFSKFTAVPTLNAPQAYQEVHCSNPGRDKVYTDWMYFATRLSLQPHATLESSPPPYASSVPNGYLWLIAPVVLHQEHSTSFMLANTFLEPPTISACVSQLSTLRLLTALLPPKVQGI
jgi:hypothetical protein